MIRLHQLLIASLEIVFAGASVAPDLLRIQSKSSDRLDHSAAFVWLDIPQLPGVRAETVGNGVRLPSGLVATARHVILGVRQVTANFGQEGSFDLTELRADDIELDVVVLGPKTPPQLAGDVDVRETPLRQGEGVRFYRWDNLRGVESADGIFAGYHNDPVRGWTIRCVCHRIDVGWSGAPVIDYDGRLVGILVEGSSQFATVIPITRVLQLGDGDAAPAHVNDWTIDPRQVEYRDVLLNHVTRSVDSQRQGDLNQAAIHMTEVARHADRVPEAMRVYYWYCLLLGEPRIAASFFASLQPEERLRWLALLYEGKALSEMGRRAAAQERLLRSFELHPTASAAAELADVTYESGEWEEAAEWARRAGELSPGVFDVVSIEVFTRAAIGDQAGATAWAVAQYETYRTVGFAALAVERLLEQGHREQADAILSQIDPWSVSEALDEAEWGQIANALSMAGRFAEGSRAFSRAVELGGQSVRGEFLEGWAQAADRAGDPATATEAASRVLQRDISSSVASDVLLANISSDNANPSPQALANFERHCEVMRQPVDYWAALGVAYAKSGRHEDAERIAARLDNESEFLAERIRRSNRTMAR